MNVLRWLLLSPGKITRVTAEVSRYFHAPHWDRAQAIPLLARPGWLDAWDVDRLIELTAELPVEEVPLQDLYEIDSVYWFDESERPTVRKVVEHFRLLQEVDPSYPIIVGPDNRVMDGMHRVARALLEERKTIRAVRLPELPEPDFRACRPGELPYER